MLCKYCGAEIEDDVVTCTSCGKTLSEDEAQPEAPVEAESDENITEEAQTEEKAPQEEEPLAQEFFVEAMEAPVRPRRQRQGYQQSTGQTQVVKDSYSPYPVISCIKKAATSGLNLTTTIIYTVLTVIIPVFLFLLLNMVPDLVKDMKAENADSAISADALSIIILIVGACIILPCFFYMLGKWIVYISGRGRRKSSMSRGGFVLIKIATVFRLIFNCIFFGGMTLLCLFSTIVEFISQASFDGFGLFDTKAMAEAMGMRLDSMPLFLLFVTVVLGVTFVLDLIFNVKIMAACNALGDMAITGRKSTDEVSLFLIIMLFFVGAILCISGILALIALFPVPLIMGVTYILHGITLIKVRKETSTALASQPQMYN